jgi:flagellar motor protein MotB
MKLRTGIMAALVLSFAVAGTGCAGNKTNAERDSLLKQNEDLKHQLDAEKARSADADARAAAAAQTPASSDVTAPPMEGGPMDMSAGLPTPTPAGRGRSGRGSNSSVPEIGGVSSSTNNAGETVLEISGDVLFDSGKAALKPSARKTLDSVATTLKSRYSGQQIRVEGHTDPAPVRSSGWDDNWDLGAARARAVMLYLNGKGVRHMYIASFAATELKSTKNNALNRRVDIVVVRNAK